MGRVTTDGLRHGMLLSALALGMPLLWQSEWQLALAVGWPPTVAWCAPAILDLYIASALLAHRDVIGALLVSALSVLTSHAVYAAPSVWQGARVGGDSHLIWYAAATCSVVPLLVIWRVHMLLNAPVPVVEVEPAAATDITETPSVEPAPDVEAAPDRADPLHRQAVKWIRSETARTGKRPTHEATRRKYHKSKTWVSDVMRAAAEPESADVLEMAR